VHCEPPVRCAACPLLVSHPGAQVFERLGDARFETVLIDEAAQATELANLQAFAFGCKQ
jgi:AAA domain